MKNCYAESIQHSGFEIRVEQDTDLESPRREWDNAGTMVCFHRKYDLGDKGHGFSSPEAFREFVEEQPDLLVLPLYLLDHSGIAISTGDFGDPWDSGQVGWIYMSPERIQSEFNGDRDKAEACLKGEVTTYNQYLTGDVWWYQILDKDGDQVDSCGGMYGYDYCVTEAKQAAEASVSQLDLPLMAAVLV